MKSPILVIMAAGLGSRFGSLKQIAPVDDDGHIIIDYSLYDAHRAGFRDVMIVINPAREAEFDERIADAKKHLNITYVYQTLDKIPAGYVIPEGREKPWGTGHAVLCAKPFIDAPFAVINADDFYGVGAFKKIFDFLTSTADASHQAMVGYMLENTLSKSGSVARGVCHVQDNRLIDIVETLEISPADGGATYPLDGDEKFLQNGTIVSMNMWGFGASVMDTFEDCFKKVLDAQLAINPLKCEFHLPLVVSNLLNNKMSVVEVLPTTEKWYGVTYVADMPEIQSALSAMRHKGIYPNNFWYNEL